MVGVAGDAPGELDDVELVEEELKGLFPEELLPPAELFPKGEFPPNALLGCCDCCICCCTCCCCATPAAPTTVLSFLMS